MLVNTVNVWLLLQLNSLAGWHRLLLPFLEHANQLCNSNINFGCLVLKLLAVGLGYGDGLCKIYKN